MVPPKISRSSFLEPVNINFYGKETCRWDSAEDPKMGRLLWIMWWARISRVLERQVEEDLMTEKERQCDNEKQIREVWPQIKKCWPPPEAGRGRVFHWSLQEEPALLIP